MWLFTIQFCWVLCRPPGRSIARACVASCAALVWPAWHFWFGSCCSEFSFCLYMPRLPVDLDRFTQRCHLSGTFVNHIWINFEIAIIVAVYLDTHTVHRLFFSCLVIQVDRSDVALGATSIRLNCHSQPWTVPTPPLQHFSPVASSASPWWDSSSNGSEAQEGG